MDYRETIMVWTVLCLLYTGAWIVLIGLFAIHQLLFDQSIVAGSFVVAGEILLLAAVMRWWGVAKTTAHQIWTIGIPSPNVECTFIGVKSQNDTHLYGKRSDNGGDVLIEKHTDEQANLLFLLEGPEPGFWNRVVWWLYPSLTSGNVYKPSSSKVSADPADYAPQAPKIGTCCSKAVPDELISKAAADRL